MTDVSSTGQRKRLKHGILAAIGVFGSAQLIYYFGWSGRFSAEFTRAPVPEAIPMDTIETDRACVLLDRSFTSATQPDFTRTGLKQWTGCQTLNSTSGWIIQHCTVPGNNPTQKDGEPVVDSLSCYPGGYFRIQRLQPLAGKDILQTGTCQLKAGMSLAEDAATSQYATSYLGPDTFRIILVGPERLSLMQQQSLGNCTYAIPYLISRPGRFWVQKVLHTYQGYDALNEIASEKGSPEYLGNDILVAGTQQQQAEQHYYHFNVCPHCVSWVAMDEAQGLAGTRDTCSRAPTQQSHQYGIYRARLPIESVWQAVGHPYEWIPARPRCRFYPAQTSFEPVTNSDSKDVKAEKAEAAQCLQNARSIYFVGDSHVRTIFSGVMQRLQGRSGGIDARIQDQRSHTIKAGKVEARSDLDASLNDTLARIRYTVEDLQVATVADLSVLEDADTVVLGFGSFFGHWPTEQYVERVKAVLDGLVEIRKQRELNSDGNNQDKMNSLKVIWVSASAWTDDSNQHWRTNHRILYWNKLVDGMIDTINAQIGGGGMVDRLLTFDITIPFKNSTQDHVHYTGETPVDSFSAELIHKLDLCS
ncbi:hypothetical protein BC939DRAFT_453750 [Gamsiella multidivaricata]|uniref:uncharacterized protein n=1 Tax=Gamsiella multidivaricata TaxID=101098 RepID=UPI0022205582|nr:uncharacterized protein BC939DRAFT_453750 [Gamsiella multidivaricata]KAG0369504.1 hypothetical protein BGZ54_009722 [Gamsiella multidivaricata]KAI7822596.1 hypothetical protein BC939DRAFT_453750 [Gamsiella multidivaricata]